MFSKTNLSVMSLMNAQQSFLDINFFSLSVHHKYPEATFWQAQLLRHSAGVSNT